MTGWSPARPLLMADGRPVYVEQPDVVQTRRGLVMMGAPTFVWPVADTVVGEEVMKRATPPPPSAGVLLDSAGSVTALVPLPPGVESMSGVRMLGDESGGAHVFWGASVRDSANAIERVPTLSHARFDGDAWSTPELVIDVRRIYLGRTTVAVLRSHGTLHLVASAADTTPAGAYRDGIVYARRLADGRWSSQWVAMGPHGGSLRYVALVAGRAGSELGIAFTGQVREHPDSIGEHGLYVVLSPDSGKTWAQPSLVRHLPLNSGYFLDAVRSPEGEAVLLWTTRAEANRVGVHTPSIVHVMISGDGRAWRARPDLELPSGLADRAIVTTTTEGIYLLASESQNHLRLRHWPFSSGADAGWQERDILGPVDARLYPTLSAPGTGTLVATLGTIRWLRIENQGNAILPALGIAVYRTCEASR